MSDNTLLSSEICAQKQAQTSPYCCQILCSCKLTAPSEQRDPECITIQKNFPVKLTSHIFILCNISRDFIYLYVFIFGNLTDILGNTILSLVPKCVAPEYVSPGSGIALSSCQAR